MMNPESYVPTTVYFRMHIENTVQIKLSLQETPNSVSRGPRSRGGSRRPKDLDLLGSREI